MDLQVSKSTYTYVEVQELLESLRDADYARLLQIYRTFGCEPRAGLAAYDVLSQVVCKVLAMERSWPRNIDTNRFLVETGRSVISNEEKKYTRVVITDPTIIDHDEVATQNSETLVNNSTPVPDAQAIDHQRVTQVEEWVSKIQSLFSDDEDATCYITQKLAEVKKAAILIACKFTDQVYRNIEKRIKDKVRKRFPKGIPWWEIKS